MSDTPDTSAAEAFEKYLVPTVFGPWSEMLVDHARISEGEHVLDIGCGTGAASRFAADKVGSSGKVKAIDLNAGMIAWAETLEDRVEWLVGDVTQMPYEDDEFDAVIGNQVLQFLPDKQAALAEVCRVLKPNGRLALNVYSRIELCPGHCAVAKALESHDVDPAGIQNPYSFNDPVELGDEIAAGGFKDVSVVRKTHEARFESPEKFVEALAAGGPSARHALEQLDADGLKQVMAEVSETLAEYVDEDGLRILTTSNLVFARRG